MYSITIKIFRQIICCEMLHWCILPINCIAITIPQWKPRVGNPYTLTPVGRKNSNICNQWSLFISFSSDNMLCTREKINVMDSVCMYLKTEIQGASDHFCMNQSIPSRYSTCHTLMKWHVNGSAIIFFLIKKLKSSVEVTSFGNMT